MKTDGCWVDKANYPTIFQAFLLIDYDNGGVNRLEPEKDHVLVPAVWGDRLHEVEAGLARLSQAELETLCAGERSDALGLVAAYGLESADQLMEEYFDGFEATGGPKV